MKRRKFLEVGLFSPILAKGDWLPTNADSEAGPAVAPKDLHLENSKLAIRLDFGCLSFRHSACTIQM